MDLILDLIVSAVSLSVIAQYSWSLKAHFNSPKMPTGTVVISVVVLTTAAIYVALLWIESQPLLATLVALMLEGLAIWMFWSAIKASRAARLKMAFDVRNPHGLVTGGPYRYLRHPFYTSYLIFWIGWAVATWSLWSVVPLVVITVIYVLAALGEERKFSRTEMAADYADYRRRTGFFWPRLGGNPQSR
jgi:protein-S-isoprenylcysteine O-methyltransferase Ste14